MLCSVKISLVFCINNYKFSIIEKCWFFFQNYYSFCYILAHMCEENFAFMINVLLNFFNFQTSYNKEQ